MESPINPKPYRSLMDPLKENPRPQVFLNEGDVGVADTRQVSPDVPVDAAHEWHISDAGLHKGFRV